jgi:glycosyltransferase involved in cell wall biosynthesis
MEPLVSVVVTTYNQAPYIGATLASVFSQTYPASEVILVDDGSTDETYAKIADFRSRLVYVKQRNRGVAAARNVGVERARGELIALLDGDDLWEPEKIALQVAASRSHPEAGLIVANGVHFHGDAILRQSLVAGPLGRRLTGVEPVTLSCHQEFLEGNPIATTSQVVVPSAVMREIGPSDVRLPIASDWDMYLRITARHRVTFLPQKLTRWRYVATSASGALEQRSLRWACDEVRILRKHLRSAAPASRPVIARLLSRKIRSTAETVYYGTRSGRLVGGRRYLLALWLQNPSSIALAGYSVSLALPQTVVAGAMRAIRRLRGS